MKYYDCFTFFGELELLKIRCEALKELNPIHVLVEATSTHAGDEKELIFEKNEELFSQYNIRHIVCDLPNDGDPWHNENFQRDAIMDGLYDLQDEDILVISDVDEIPKPEVFTEFDPADMVCAIGMDQYCYYLNCLQGRQTWTVARIVSGEYLKKTTPNKVRNIYCQKQIVNAGHHFSWLGGVDKIVEKTLSYAHTENNNSKFLDVEKLKYKLETGQSIWGDDYWDFVEIDKSFPPYLQANQNLFTHLIKQK